MFKKGEKNVETIKLFCFCVWLGLEKIKEKNTTYYLLAMLVVVGAQHSVRTLSLFRLFAKIQATKFDLAGKVLAKSW